MPVRRLPDLFRQKTPRRNVSGEVLRILLAQRRGTRSERWALQPDGSSPSGAVSPSQICASRCPVPRRPAIAEVASARYRLAERCTACEPTTSYCGLSHERRFGSFQIDHSLTVV